MSRHLPRSAWCNSESKNEELRRKKSKEKNALQGFNNFLRLYIALPVKNGYRESCTWWKNKLAKDVFRRPKFADPA
jgi:hypothetical protein